MEPIAVASLVIIALSQAVGAVLKAKSRLSKWRAERLAEDGPTKDHYPTVFIPLACGMAAHWEGITDTCARRKAHAGRCMSDAEIEHIAECGHRTTVEPAPPTEIAELLKHSDAIPLSLFSGGHLSTAELNWVAKARQLIETVAAGDHFCQWEDTRV